MVNNALISWWHGNSGLLLNDAHIMSFLIYISPLPYHESGDRYLNFELYLENLRKLCHVLSYPHLFLTAQAK